MKILKEIGLKLHNSICSKYKLDSHYFPYFSYFPLYRHLTNNSFIMEISNVMIELYNV